ncbi:MAG: hypothetical protein ABIZ70_02475 [Gemmatimonadales bacterium]
MDASTSPDGRKFLGVKLKWWIFLFVVIGLAALVLVSEASGSDQFNYKMF